MENEDFKKIMSEELRKEGYDGFMFLPTIDLIDRYEEMIQSIKDPKCFCTIDKDFMKCLNGSNKDITFVKCHPIYKVICNHDQSEECDIFEFCINTDKNKCPYKD